MKEILILRHGKSDWDVSVLNDYDRPLNKKGRKASKLMGKKILEFNLMPDIILSSSAVRAEKTTKIITKNCLFVDEPQYFEGFYSEDEDFIISTIKQLDNDADRVMIIGHNPILSNLILKLTSYEMDMKIKFPTSGLAQITCNIDKWSDLKEGVNELGLLLYPKLFKKSTIKNLRSLE